MGDNMKASPAAPRLLKIEEVQDNETLKEKYNQKASKLLTLLSVIIVMAASPVVYIFSYLNLISESSFWWFLIFTSAINLLIYIVSKLYIKRKETKFVIITLMFTLPFVINLVLTSQAVWTVLFVYLFLSLVYLDKNVYYLSSGLGLINLFAIIYFDPTAISESQEIAVMFILYLFAAIGGLFVATNGDKLISRMEATTTKSEKQAKNLVEVIKAAQGSYRPA